jgi:AcrR family transcriptional regulator
VPQGTPTTVTPPPSSPAEPSGPSAAKPLRADARRNQARVLETAEAVFAAKGTAASTEEIARQAGVGIGTVFRHFPTKEALLEAVFVGRLRRLADEVDALAAAKDQPRRCSRSSPAWSTRRSTGWPLSTPWPRPAST